MFVTTHSCTTCYMHQETHGIAKHPSESWKGIRTGFISGALHSIYLNAMLVIRTRSMTCKGTRYYNAMPDWLQRRSVCLVNLTLNFWIWHKSFFLMSDFFPRKNSEKMTIDTMNPCTTPDIVNKLCTFKLLFRVSRVVFCKAVTTLQNSHAVPRSRHSTISQQYTLCATNSIDHSDV